MRQLPAQEKGGMMLTTKEQRSVMKKRLWEWGTALSECERRREEIRDLQKQMEEMDDVLRGQTIDDMPKGTGVGNPTVRALEVKERTACRIALLLEEIAQIMQRKERMDTIIATMPEKYQTLIDLKYKKGRGLSVEIPRMMHASERSVAYWHDDILERLHVFAENL